MLACICIVCVCIALRDQKRVLDPLELLLTAVMSHHVGDNNSSHP